MTGTAPLQDSAHAIRKVFRYESSDFRDGTCERCVDAVHHLVSAASMRAGNRRPFLRVYGPRRRTRYVRSFAVFDFQRRGNVKVRHILSFIPAR